MGKAWTPGMKAEFLRLVAARKTSDEIAAEMGISTCAVYRAAKRHGVRVHNPHAWTPEAIDLLKTYLGHRKSSHIAASINGELGTKFNAISVNEQARKIGIRARDNTGDYIVSDAAKEIGITRDAFLVWARRLGITLRKSGPYTYVTMEDVDKVRELFADPPEPCYTAKQAASRLGIGDTVLRSWKMRGQIRHHKRGWELLIPVAEVNRVLRERRFGRVEN